MLADCEVWVDRAVDSTVETLTSSDKSAETTLDTDVADESTAEMEVPSDVAAEVIADVETTLLTTTMVLKNEDVWVDATVARLATLETPDDVLVSDETLLEMLVCSAVTWLSAVEPPAEAAPSFNTAVETAELSNVCCDRIVDTPTVVVDSDVERLVKALRPEETWALVGVAASATMVEMAVESSTASEVVLERLVLSSVAPESAVDATTPAEVVLDRAVEVMLDSEVWDDSAVLEDVEIAVAMDCPPEICAVWEV